MENLGWVKIHRRFAKWEWYQDSNMVHLFLHLILSANRKPGKWKGTEIARGQLVTGRKKLSEDTGISERSIRTCLNRLKSTSELTIKTTNKFSIITICNYELYQIENPGSDQQSDQPTANKRPATDHKQEDKEDKEVKNKRVNRGNNEILFEKVKKGLSYDLPRGFDELIFTWLKYKSEKGQPYKETGLKSLIEKLIKETGGNVKDAGERIEYSMANNYTGIFPPKQSATKNNRAKGSTRKHDSDY